MDTKNKLLKKIYGYLKASNQSTPIPKIAVALSGGSDSMALALLLAKYGKSLYSESLVFIHINHMWRGQESINDAKFVKSFGESLGVETHIHECKPSLDKKVSKELEARNQRLDVFKSYANQGYIIFTAHTSNDVLETMLWRLCSGELKTKDKGILIKTEDNQFRPFLTTEKNLLLSFLKEEKQVWVEDYTNHDGLLMRSNLRKNVIPSLLKIYPNALRNVSLMAIQNQQ